MERENFQTQAARPCRIEPAPGAIRQALRDCEPGTPVAVEATGNWYWIISEIEPAGLCPWLVPPRKAKLMRGLINKTDKLDVPGLNRRQRNGTLPTGWIPPAELRDLRELTRVRRVLAAQRTRLKNRISATLAKYGLAVTDARDPYCPKARSQLLELLGQLPAQTPWAARTLVTQLDFIEGQIREPEQRLKQLLAVTAERQRWLSLPGVGVIFSAVIWLEIGSAERFASAQRLASYAGTTPRVPARGGKVRYGRLRPDVNRYLKWAFAEAGNSVAVNPARCPDRHVSELYRRLKARKGHAKAIGAVARHLAEATFYVLNGQQPYQDPKLVGGRSKGGVSAKLS